MGRFHYALAGFLSCVVVSYAQAHAPSRVIVLTSREIGHLYIQADPLKPATFTPAVRGYGVIMDLSQLAQVDSSLATAQAAVQQSEADVKRYRALDQSGAISRQTLDSAEKQAATDRAQLLLAERNAYVQFGQHAPWLGAHAEKAILQRLTSGKAILVKATFPLDSLQAVQPNEISVSHLSAQQDQREWSSKTIWSAPADPSIPGRSFFVLIEGSDLQPGEHALVSCPTGPSVRGVAIPAAAVVISDGKPWFYLQVDARTFERRQIDLALSLPGGYFVAGNPAGAVVVRGTGLLLARELGAATSLRY